MFVLVAVGLVVLVAALSRSAGATPVQAPRLHPDIRRRVEAWRSTVNDESSFPRLSASLVLGVIARESGGDSAAIGSTDDYGLMQITRPAWVDYMRAHPNDTEATPFPDALLDSRVNVRVGSWFLSQKIGELGGTFDGLRAYNAGAAAAARDPHVSADYARWVVEVGEPAFRSIA